MLGTRYTRNRQQQHQQQQQQQQQQHIKNNVFTRENLFLSVLMLVPPTTHIVDRL
jgi:transcription initiation factor TFIID subunit TAF12